ncbi:MAG: ADP-ribosylglycohydrolase family protein [Abditibacteriota bacterium]|nr:ADP-ribosylglycohydrolase family protein [Abditibacteriota bacterium]
MTRSWMQRNPWAFIDCGDVAAERLQCIDEGKDISPLADEFDRLEKTDMYSPEAQRAAGELLDKSAALPCPGPLEPSGLAEIQALAKGGPDMPLPVGEALSDKFRGAWLGRIAGCTFGKPFEGRRKRMIGKYLKETGNYPPTHYISYRGVDPELIRECGIPDWTDRICHEHMDYAIHDDDLTYPLVNLVCFRDHGKNFTPEDVASAWMKCLPFGAICTAERVAYRNLCCMVEPPASACFRNPYREWVGAQIRADLWGWVSPGKPGQAAGYAWRDACISHVKNGIYGEMWAAAMMAAAFATDDVKEVIRAGLSRIPAKSRLAGAVGNMISLYDSGASYEEAADNIASRWNEDLGHHWCHTLSNAEIITAALLWGEKDFARTVFCSVFPGFDTDSNGATAGSVLGIMLGGKAIPENWKGPIHDTLETFVPGFGTVKVSEMAALTEELSRL